MERRGDPVEGRPRRRRGELRRRRRRRTPTPASSRRAAAACGSLSVYVPNGRVARQRALPATSWRGWRSCAATSHAGRHRRDERGRRRRLQHRARRPRRVRPGEVRRRDARQPARAGAARASCATGAWSTCSASCPRRGPAVHAGGTTAPATSTRAGAAHRPACSAPRRWPQRCPVVASSTATPARASCRPITRRSSSTSATDRQPMFDLERQTSTRRRAVRDWRPRLASGHRRAAPRRTATDDAFAAARDAGRSRRSAVLASAQHGRAVRGRRGARSPSTRTPASSTSARSSGALNPLAPPIAVSDGTTAPWSATCSTATPTRARPAACTVASSPPGFDEVLGFAQSLVGSAGHDRPSSTSATARRRRCARQVRYRGRLDRVDGRKIFTAGDAARTATRLCAEARACSSR